MEPSGLVRDPRIDKHDRIVRDPAVVRWVKIQEALDFLDAIRNRYRSYSEMDPIFRAADEVRRRYDQPEGADEPWSDDKKFLVRECFDLLAQRKQD